MKRYILPIFLFVFLMPFAAEAKQPVAQAIANWNAIGFEKPNVSSKQLGVVKKGTVINVLDYNSVWIHAELNGKRGYVKRKYFSEYKASKESASKGQQIVNFGKRYLGTPYKLGGGRRDNQRYFDCSGFVWYVYTQNGVKMSMGGARDQYRFVGGRNLSYNELRVGDLVFFSTSATVKYPKNSINRIGHVGIYAGNGKVLHTWGEGGVRIQDMSKGWWRDHFLVGKRPI